MGTEPDSRIVGGSIDPFEDFHDNADTRVRIEQDFLGVRDLAEVAEVRLDL